MLKWLDRLTGIAWLIAAVFIPLAFNLYSQRVFEPEKAFVVRLVGLLLVVLLSVRIVITPSCHHRTRLVSSWRQPRVYTSVPAICLTVAVLVAAAVSIAPSVSWSGSYEWRQGVATFLACLVIFLSVSWHPLARDWQAVLITVIELTGAAVAGYGILQYFNLDPVPWHRVIEGRAFSTLGHPNFLAAYLVLVTPVAAARLLSSATWRGRLLHGFVLLFNLSCLFLTFSRSGWLGFLAAGGCLALFQVQSSPFRRRWLRASVIIAVALIVVSVLAYLDPGGVFSYSPLEPLHSFLRGKSATAHVRSLTWQGTWQLLGERPWTGFGPETFRLAFPRAYPPELTVYGGAVATGDHAHNEILDWASSVGVLGVIMYGWFVLSVLYAGVRSLPRISNPQQRMLLTGLLAGAVGHSIQNQLSFATIAPMSIFWLYLGLIVAVAQRAMIPPRPIEMTSSPKAPDQSGRNGTRWRKAVGLSGITAFALLAVVLVMIPHACSLKADMHARLARDAAASGDWRQSIVQYTEALRLSPTQDRYLKSLSGSYAALALSEKEHRSERFTLAINALDKAIALSPLDVRYRLSLGTLFYEWGVSGQRDKLDLALETYRQAAGISLSDPQIWSRWGRAYHAQEEYTLAIEKYQEALLLDPLHVQTYSYLGETYLAMRRLKDAREIYDRIDQVTETLDRMVSKR
jgi:O-antigen ligase/Flp pilus assembly protein TadD